MSCMSTKISPLGNEATGKDCITNVLFPKIFLESFILNQWERSMHLLTCLMRACLPIYVSLVDSLIFERKI